MRFFHTLLELRNKRSSILFVYFSLLVIFFGLLGHRFIDSFHGLNFLVAPIMAVGSFVAGSTFLGGGAVAFPALTKILAIDPVSAKTFSLSIQSVGMTSASLYIISRVPKLPYTFIILYLCASATGIAVNFHGLEHVLSSDDLRIVFTLFLVCFLCVYVYTLNCRNVSLQTHLENTPRDISLTLLCGFGGGVLSGFLGTGADLIGFSLLVLYFRMEIKIATQISVLLMAGTSLVGFSLLGGMGRISTEVMALWYIAAPVVLIGAPVGAFVCRRLSPKVLMVIIIGIVLIEFTSTLLLVPIRTDRLFYYVLIAASFTLALCVFKYQSNKKHI